MICLTRSSPLSARNARKKPNPSKKYVRNEAVQNCKAPSAGRRSSLTADSHTADLCRRIGVDISNERICMGDARFKVIAESIAVGIGEVDIGSNELLLVVREAIAIRIVVTT